MWLEGRSDAGHNLKSHPTRAHHPLNCAFVTSGDTLLRQIRADKMDITQFIYSRRDTALQLGDYAFYRAQLSRQLASTRKRLGRSTPKNAKYSTKAPITAEDIGGNPEYVDNALGDRILTISIDLRT